MKKRLVGDKQDYIMAATKICQFQEELVASNIALDVSMPIHQALAQAYQQIRMQGARSVIPIAKKKSSRSRSVR